MSSSSTDNIIERLGSKIVIASGNAHKIDEFQSLLKAPNRFVSQRDLGVVEVPETGQTFLENALIKAGIGFYTWSPHPFSWSAIHKGYRLYDW